MKAKLSALYLPRAAVTGLVPGATRARPLRRVTMDEPAPAARPMIDSFRWPAGPRQLHQPGTTQCAT